MERDQFKVLCKGMKAVYTQETFLPDADAFNVWFGLLGDLDYAVLNAAIQKYMITNKFPPTIADLRELATTIQSGEIADWGEGWEKVLNAIRYYGSYRETEALQTMDELTKTCVKRLGWRNICMSENINIDRANFRMIYEQISERKKTDAILPISLNNTIKQLNQNIVKSLEDTASQKEVAKNGECANAKQKQISY